VAFGTTLGVHRFSRRNGRGVGSDRILDLRGLRMVMSARRWMLVLLNDEQRGEDEAEAHDRAPFAYSIIRRFWLSPASVALLWCKPLNHSDAASQPRKRETFSTEFSTLSV
jgi:hypothetical protein